MLSVISTTAVILTFPFLLENMPVLFASKCRHAIDSVAYPSPPMDSDTSHCSDCRKMIKLMEAREVKQDVHWRDLDHRNNRKAFDKARIAVANHELHLERKRQGETDVPRCNHGEVDPIGLGILNLPSDFNPSKRRQYAHFDATQPHRDESKYRDECSFRRASKVYRPGVHSPRVGREHLNTSNPRLYYARKREKSVTPYPYEEVETGSTPGSAIHLVADDKASKTAHDHAKPENKRRNVPGPHSKSKTPTTLDEGVEAEAATGGRIEGARTVEEQRAERARRVREWRRRVKEDPDYVPRYRKFKDQGGAAYVNRDLRDFPPLMEFDECKFLGVLYGTLDEEERGFSSTTGFDDDLSLGGTVQCRGD